MLCFQRTSPTAYLGDDGVLYNMGDKTILGTSSELPDFGCENAPDNAVVMAIAAVSINMGMGMGTNRASQELF